MREACKLQLQMYSGRRTPSMGVVWLGVLGG